MHYSETWDLDSIFAGGIDSPALTAKMSTIKQQLTTTADTLVHWRAAADTPDADWFTQLFNSLQAIQAGIDQATVFVVAYQSAHADDTKAAPLLNQIYQLDNQLNNLLTRFKKQLVKLDQATFDTLVQQPSLQAIAFNLTEMRQQGLALLDDDTEALINDLALDGFQGWSDHYDTLVSQIQVPYTDENGITQQLSAGQAQNMLAAAMPNAQRAELMRNWEHAWQTHAAPFADTLNHLAGFRLANYRAHGTTNFLQKPLELNRMSQATLDTMYQVVADSKEILLSYLKRKAQLLGKDQLDWQDIEAPLTLGQLPNQTYDQAADFVINNFRQFSPKMGALAQHALEHRWVEAENRPNKRPGGYMENLPETHESRIFMTFTDSPNDTATLAHELGHAFHGSVIQDLPLWRQDYAMNVAETASTFAELIVADASVKAADDAKTKLTLLDAKMQNPLAMFLDIRARFLFETRFYAARQHGIVTPDTLSDLMLTAQKDAYGNALNTYHPMFWASKLHFYIDDVPFYNFPYTFGYLFSLGIYAQAKTQSDFEDRYIALLRDTANMSTEALAAKHLGVDLTKPAFWQAGVALIKRDIDEFMALSAPLI
ncbi:M3 family oligoendopeptidase [Lactiplantibacillus plantarum]|uniref:M3 family oligoendopeptidase n=1 Tax=Lactiplantibacillus plantarum TaxID=1590 RepID=UPI002040A296|nr:M3 family oligoendopeptidase [Lactiplantibacillus plantarum]MCM2587233.1 M3 family oligoendopeptidase [Lactiplantibacillus plantarum]MCM2598291.1 M3 family oligoendopeptidase [Lactiplantibacillus plantarum]MCM2600255.1 M3 family oligoendopeptidase [Lactiplantibacillus plantarum]MCM2608805.1 M3 family oligoendopeptidase [Lactiplantibacillus plantarum]MCM2610602.1 M3 family oligoendopeptidase [Lactiplantibacillus plantarum]